MLNNKKTLFWLILFSFLLIPIIVSVISSIHVINFFEISNNKALAIALSVSFEIGALSALAGLVVLDKINKNVIYFIFFLLTAYQMMGNTYFAYDVISQKMITNPDLIKNWAELFGFDVEDIISMKRLIAIISGAVLPIVSLCFLDLSVDYIKKSAINNVETETDKKKAITEIPVIKTSDEIENQELEDESQIEVIEKIEYPTETIVEEVTNVVEPIVEESVEPILEPIVEEEKHEEEVITNESLVLEEIKDEKDTPIVEEIVKPKKNTIAIGPRNLTQNISYHKE